MQLNPNILQHLFRPGAAYKELDFPSRAGETQGLQRLPLVSLFYTATLVNDGVGRICMRSPAGTFLNRLVLLC